MALYFFEYAYGDDHHLFISTSKADTKQAHKVIGGDSVTSIGKIQMMQGTSMQIASPGKMLV